MGEGRRGRGFGLQAAGFRRGRRARASARRGRTGLQNASEGTEAKTLTSLFINPVILPVRVLNSLSARGGLTTYLLRKVAPWSENAWRRRRDGSLRSDCVHVQRAPVKCGDRRQWRPGKVKTLVKRFYCFCFPGEGRRQISFLFFSLWLGVASLIFPQESTQA